MARSKMLLGVALNQWKYHPISPYFSKMLNIYANNILMSNCMHKIYDICRNREVDRFSIAFIIDMFPSCVISIRNGIFMKQSPCFYLHFWNDPPSVAFSSSNFGTWCCDLVLKCIPEKDRGYKHKMSKFCITQFEFCWDLNAWYNIIMP